MGQAVVRYLTHQYSERDGHVRRLVPGMFGIMGHGNVAGVGAALAGFREEMRYLQVRNEQSMVHAAIGFAKESKGLSTLACSASIGPGATNMITGATTATINRIPVLLLPSDIYVTRRQGPVLQQIEHPLEGDTSSNDAFRPVSRYFDRISRAEQLLTALPEAMRVLTTPGETGAVTLALPQDLQSMAHDYPASFFTDRQWRVRRPEPSDADIADVLELLASAERPLIVAGGGVLYSDATAELMALARAAGIPVAETFAGRGACTEDDWFCLGGLGVTGNPMANAVARRADLVVAVGTRLADFVTASQSLFQDPGVRFVGINVCAQDAYKNGALPVVADAKVVLRRLSEGLSPAHATDDSYRHEVSGARREWTVVRDAVLAPSQGTEPPQAQVVGALQRAAQPGDVIIAAAGSAPGDLMMAWDASGDRSVHLEWGTSCMGYEIPAGIGARLARPDGEVVVFIGDGTFLMQPSEIVSAVQERARLTIVISVNHGFQCIRDLQLATTGVDFGNEFRVREGSALAGDYVDLDLAKVAEGLGAIVHRADTIAEFETALAQSRTAERTTVIVIETTRQRALPGSGVWNEVIPPEVAIDGSPEPLHAAYVEARDRVQRFYY
jgi:3D-(3,5/4)-trihydroxycyclohexane-1,2-dione acylhydrolase (decyclizing)